MFDVSHKFKAAGDVQGYKFIANQNQQGFQHIAPDVMSGHTNHNEMTFSYTGDETRWYMFTTVDGAAKFNRELLSTPRQQWSIEGPFTLTVPSHG